ncbi:MAG: AraC family transcriptional regulator [Phycisphaerae bacterium]|nr:AraC family transcriptional regulator [Phycisphaerae bacterium]
MHYCDKMTRRFSSLPSRPTRGSRSARANPTTVNRARFFEIDNLHVTLRLGSYRVETLYWGVLGEKWWRNYLHAHSFFEMCFAYGGRGTFRIRDQEHPVERGEMFLATPGLSHEIISSRTQPLGIYFVAFTLLRVPDHTASEADRPIDLLLESLGQTRKFVVRPSPLFEHTLELLTEEVASKPPGYTQAIHGLAGKLILDTARAYSEGVPAEPLPPLERGSKAIVQTAARYLRDNYSRPIEVRDVAAQVHLSERHLSRLFARETGKSILEYLTDLRIEAASQLLLDEAIPIKQVARSVGYPDPHYFTTLFGRKTGTTPGVFRQQRGTRFRDEAKRGVTGGLDESVA